MKLKSKDTGKVAEVLAVALDKSGAIILMVDIDGRREVLMYKTLAQLHKELEDYDEAEKPALTEKEHDYLVSWLNLINYASYDGIKRNKNRLDLMHGQQDVSSIPTFGRFRWWPDGKSYTIAELGL